MKSAPLIQVDKDLTDVIVRVLMAVKFVGR